MQSVARHARRLMMFSGRRDVHERRRSVGIEYDAQAITAESVEVWALKLQMLCSSLSLYTPA